MMVQQGVKQEAMVSVTALPFDIELRAFSVLTEFWRGAVSGVWRERVRLLTGSLHRELC